MMSRSIGMSLIILGALSIPLKAQTRSDVNSPVDQADLNQKRLNELQYIGTHNSYHVAPSSAVSALLWQNNITMRDGWNTRELADALQYSHLPLGEQLSLGIRVFELDLLADPHGGRFTSRQFDRILSKRNLPGLQYSDLERDMQKPGFKVLHTPDFDQNTTCRLFAGCLEEMADWSIKNPDHLPVIVFLQPKENTGTAVDANHKTTDVLKFGPAEWSQLNAMLVGTLGPQKVFTPEELRDGSVSILQRLSTSGWPTVEALRGKFLFFYFLPDRETEQFSQYVDERTENNMFNVSWSLEAGKGFIPRSDSPLAVFLDPYSSHIREAVSKNLLVLTRADAHTREARENSYARRDQAFTSGSNIILTDYPYRNPVFSNYVVKFSGPNPYVRVWGNAPKEN